MFRFESLDVLTCRHMLIIKVEQAIKTSQLNISRRFTVLGCERYPQLLRTATTSVAWDGGLRANRG